MKITVGTLRQKKTNQTLATGTFSITTSTMMTKMNFQMDGLKALALINSKIKGVDKPIIVDGYFAKTTQSSHE